jgi:hypothetical protein
LTAHTGDGQIALGYGSSNAEARALVVTRAGLEQLFAEEVPFQLRAFE